MVTEGKFRQDLYFRLNIFPIDLPPLRERREDIPALAETLLNRVSVKRELTISPEAMRLLVAYNFPGNVRELRNIMERASLLCDADELCPEHLPDEVRIGEVSNFSAINGGGNGSSSSDAVAVSASWDEIQLQTLREVVAAHRGTRQELARKLGISVRTLYRRLAEAKISVVETGEG
jgi:DNA-binding NtrC family response regulator